LKADTDAVSLDAILTEIRKLQAVRTLGLLADDGAPVPEAPGASGWIRRTVPIAISLRTRAEPHSALSQKSTVSRPAPAGSFRLVVDHAIAENQSLLRHRPQPNRWASGQTPGAR
jgi:hypothetical protein